jgi:glycosyltransferase involved in cell wall biosynthesis
MISNDNLVTIGIPTYLRPLKLKQCLKSVIDQSHKNLEVLVSSNSSDNETRNIINSFNDERIKYFEQNSNIGSTENFNFLLKKASGKYFMWCSDDDYLSQNFIETALPFIDDEHIACYGNATYKSSGRTILVDGKMSIDYNDSFNRVAEYLKQVGNNGIFYSLYRLSSIRDLRLYNKIGNDWIFVSEALLRGKYNYTDSITIFRDLANKNNASGYKSILRSIGDTSFQNIKTIFPHIFIAINVASLTKINKGNAYFRNTILRMRMVLIVIKRWLPDMFHPIKLKNRLAEAFGI